MKRILVFSAIVFMSISFSSLSVLFIFAQSKDNSESVKKEPRPIYKSIKKSGWDIPTIEEKDFSSEKPKNIDNQIITEKKYKLQNARDMQLELYSLNTDDSLNTGAVEVEVREVITYSLNGRAFACKMSLIKFSKNENGAKIFAGLIIPAYYSDEDGDGKFEVRYLGSRDETIKIPSWLMPNKNS